MKKEIFSPMKSFFAKIIFNSFSEDRYYKLRQIYYDFDFYKLLDFFFLKQKIKKIDSDLILIGQVQRSGGSLLSQLFDNHKEIYSFPNELIITQPKNNWKKKMHFSTTLLNTRLSKSSSNNNYTKPGKNQPKNNIKNLFLFNPFIEKKIFNKLEKKNKNNNLRTKFNNYFTAFFNAFLNYKNKKNKKKFILAFLPGFFNFKNNVNLFFKIYPNGYLVNIIRDPQTWLGSAKMHSFRYMDSKASLSYWEKNFKNAIELKKKYKDRIIIIKFEDLVKHNEKTIKKLCSLIKISFDLNLLKPTFNGSPILSNSSFKSVQNTINLSPLKKNNFSFNSKDKLILSKYIKIYNDLEKKYLI